MTFSRQTWVNRLLVDFPSQSVPVLCILSERLKIKLNTMPALEKKQLKIQIVVHCSKNQQIIASIKRTS